MMVDERSGREANWQQVRERIDAAHAPGKTTPPEPALAAMGTDDEAAGYTAAPADIARSAGPETKVTPQPNRRSLPAWFYVVVALVLLGLAFLFLGTASA
jgi:hypothetical protein